MSILKKMKADNHLNVFMALVIFICTTSVLSSCAKDDECGENKPNKTPEGVVAVDLGLSVKWANMNIGATTPESYGLYFAWGETIGYGLDTSDGHLFYWSSYKWCKVANIFLTKYCISPSHGTVDSKTVLDLEDDAAHVNWGGSWRLPTKAEQDELLDNCTWTWTRQNGVNGYKVTSKTSTNSIFLPAAGYRRESEFLNAGYSGYYWSSSLSTTSDGSAYDLDLASINFARVNTISRDAGISVRAVCP